MKVGDLIDYKTRLGPRTIGLIVGVAEERSKFLAKRVWIVHRTIHLRATRPGVVIREQVYEEDCKLAY